MTNSNQVAFGIARDIHSTVSARDDVCVLSVIGTAAIINHQFTTSETNKGQAVGTKDTASGVAVDTELSKDLKQMHVSQKNGGDSTANDVEAATNNVNNASSTTPTGCSLCHIPYSKLALPVNGKMKKCSVCK